MKYVGFFLLFFFAFSVGIVSMRYLDFGVKGLLIDKSELLQSKAYLFFFYLHVISGIVAMMSGPFQFVAGLRNKFLNLHRSIGKIYVVACMFAGVAGFVIGIFAEGGWVASLGFTSMAVVWIICTYNAWRSIKQKLIPQHQAWMIRSYAVTLAAVTLRLWIPIFMAGFGMEFIPSYVIISWLCWVPNLFVAQWIIQKQGILKTKHDLQSA